MNFRKLIAPLALGIGMSTAFLGFAASNLSPYESCVLDCHKNYQICIQGGGPQSDCSRLRQFCKWGCGTPQ